MPDCQTEDRAKDSITFRLGAKRRYMLTAVLGGAALLAASLLVGVFVGQTEFSGGALPALVELAGLDASLDAGHVDHSDED